MSCCTYSVILSRINTKDKLKEWGLDFDEVSILCEEQPKTVQHLFFQYNRNKYIWTLVKIKLESNENRDTLLSLEDELQAIKLQFRNKDQLWQLASCSLVTAIYHLLEERNKRIFNQHRLNKTEREKLIQTDIIYLMIKSTLMTTRTRQNKRISSRGRIQLRDNG